MRRKDREVTDFEMVRQIIDRCDVVRIGLTDGDAYPYIVPVNFGYTAADGQICLYIHGAMAGRKYELLKKNGVCSFEMDCGHQLELLPEAGSATMRYQCVMGKADVEFVEGEEKLRALDLLMARDERTRGFAWNQKTAGHTAVAKLTVTEYTAKINAPKEQA